MWCILLSLDNACSRIGVRVRVRAIVELTISQRLRVQSKLFSGPNACLGISKRGVHRWGNNLMIFLWVLCPKFLCENYFFCFSKFCGGGGVEGRAPGHAPVNTMSRIAEAC